MARSRNIKPGLYKNEDLAECSIWARYIFPGLWMLADREGRLEDRPKRIKGELLPYDSQDVEPLLKELATARDSEGHPFIIRYEIDGLRYIQITKFKGHQTPHYTEKPSVIKPPPLQETKGHISRQYSWSKGAIKEGSKPPDSLIPDSLIPEEKKAPVGATGPENTIWKLGLSLLTKAGQSERTARMFLGKHARNGHAPKLAEVIAHMSLHPVADPVAYIEGAMRDKAQSQAGVLGEGDLY